MNELSDNELIKRIRNGDTESLDLLIRRYSPQVKIMVRKLFLMGGEEDDLFQEGLMGIISAVKLYDENKNRSFSSFATTCIKTRIIDSIRSATRYKHKPLNEATSLDGNEGSIILKTASITDPIDIYLQKERLDNFHNNLKSVLNKQQAQILDLYLQGFSYREISDKLNISVKKIDNSLYAIKNKIRKERDKFL